MIFLHVWAGSRWHVQLHMQCVVHVTGTNDDDEVTCSPESQKMRQSCGVLL